MRYLSIAGIAILCAVCTELVLAQTSGDAMLISRHKRPPFLRLISMRCSKVGAAVMGLIDRPA